MSFIIYIKNLINMKKYNICCISISFVVIFILSCFVSKVCFTNFPKEMVLPHDLLFDERLIDQIDSLDRVCPQDTIMLRQEVQQLKRLTKYVIDREANYQMEVNLIIDKYSTWTGYWLGVIGCVLTLFTLIQAFLNYKTNNDYSKNVENAIKQTQDERDKCSSLVKEMRNEIKYRLQESEKNLSKIEKARQLSIHQNKISCICTCLSSFPDAFSLTPNEERQNYIRFFLNILCGEYSELTQYINRFICSIEKPNDLDGNFTINLNRNLTINEQDMNHIYLVWCDICIAINHAMYDFTKPIQNNSFDELKASLCNVIKEYNERKINDTNILNKMRDVMFDFQRLNNILK